jgi:hypothetical protein
VQVLRQREREAREAGNVAGKVAIWEPSVDPGISRMGPIFHEIVVIVEKIFST